MRNLAYCVALLGLFAFGAQSGGSILLPEKVPVAVTDVQDAQSPAAVQLTGWIGGRIAASESNRLVRIDTGRLLEGYRKRPGRQAWDGEHIGKWIHAATLAWVYSGDEILRKKIDAAVGELMQCQLADGYLGTYLPQDRWTEWDVWAHKYNLIGLFTYMRYTGNVAPLDTCRRMADLLCRELGDGPGQRDILTAGSQHFGMASTSVLEPMVLLYRLTGEPRYLDFCKYIVRAWEQPHGPRIVSHLLARDGVNQIGNGKGYEMLSCLNGALEMYRTTGERTLLTAAVNAWQDIVAHRLYPTGAATAEERFRGDGNMPNQNNVGETCVTVTWLQLNAQLLRLTGEARFAEQLEHIITNQLFGAQRPDGAAWGYYVQMEGKKPYSDTLDGHCCLSSGPRGVALIPTFTVGTDAAGVVVNLYDAGTARLTLRDGGKVTVSTATLYPADGHIQLTLTPEAPRAFAVKLRVPEWCLHYTLKVAGEVVAPPVSADGYVLLQRTWSPGDQIALSLTMEPHLMRGGPGNEGRVAVSYGPLVLAADTALLGTADQGIGSVSLASADPGALRLTPEPAPVGFQTWPGAQVFRLQGVVRQTSHGLTTDTPMEIRLVPFADAGCNNSLYRVWIPLASARRDNLLRDGRTTRSGPWDRTRYDGTINDGNPSTIADTFEQNKLAKEAWFAVTLLEPVSLQRVVFVHGHTDRDGGWFATTDSQPRVQVMTAMGKDWETVGNLADYPATSVTSAGPLRNSARFEFVLPEPRSVIAVRVIGVPASGDNPAQAFASCAELEGY
jgi:DUF1680 family protein